MKNKTKTGTLDYNIAIESIAVDFKNNVSTTVFSVNGGPEKEINFREANRIKAIIEEYGSLEEFSRRFGISTHTIKDNSSITIINQEFNEHLEDIEKRSKKERIKRLLKELNDLL